jgi:hypothetical protein
LDGSRPQKFFDLVGQFSADPVDLLQGLSPGDVGNVFVQGQQRVGRPPVGPDSIRVGPLAGQQIGHRSKHNREPLIVEGGRHGRYCAVHAAPAARAS